MPPTVGELRRIAGKVAPDARVELHKLGGKWVAHATWGSECEGLSGFSAHEPTARKRLGDALDGVLAAREVGRG